MSVNESEIPIFSGGIQPIGKVNGTPVASKKHAGGLMKRIMSMAKPAAKTPAKKPAGNKRAVRSRKGIEADSKIHFGSYPKYY